MHIWYVKARYQEDHEERAQALGISIILEDTSTQVNPSDPLPHVIVQHEILHGVGEDAFLEAETVVLNEPVSLSELEEFEDAETPIHLLHPVDGQ